MLSLVSRGTAESISTTTVGVVQWQEEPSVLAVYGARSELVDSTATPIAVIHAPEAAVPAAWVAKGVPRVCVAGLQPLSSGDVVALHPSGRIDTLFRMASDHNALFVTEQCNSYCLMCSQPPRRVDDLEHFLALNVRALRLMPRETRVLGITGGEPTLLGTRLADLMRACRASLTEAQVDILSNGRLLADPVLAARVGSAADQRMLFTVPLYADNSLRHDYIVQARGAFNETMAGLYNLARAGVRCEVRVVLHRESVVRLPQLARFVQKNLPFIDQVVFMGLEMTGLARANEDLLWIESPDYMPQLEAAIDYLTDLGMRVSLYNLPRCLVSRQLWQHLRISISDWKREYAAVCESCSEQARCGGLFGTSSRTSSLLRPL